MGEKFWKTIITQPVNSPSEFIPITGTSPQNSPFEFIPLTNLPSQPQPISCTINLMLQPQSIVPEHEKSDVVGDSVTDNSNQSYMFIQGGRTDMVWGNNHTMPAKSQLQVHLIMKLQVLQTILYA